MAVSQVRAQINGTWYTLTYNSATGEYEADLNFATPSIGQTGGYFNATVEATSPTAATATASGANMPGLRLVVQDTTAPTLTITSPADGLITAAASVTVSGTAFDSSGLSSVTVNGAPVTIGADNSWSTTVNLSGGANTITVKATDTAGNVSTETLAVTRATSGPELEITSPAAGALVSTESVTVSGTVSDSVSPVASVKVNGVAAAITGTTWTATIPLSEGANTLTAVAENQVGLSTTVTRAVTRDSTAPVLTVTAPENNLVTAADTVIVSGTVTDAGAVTVTVNGQAAALSNGAFSVPVVLEGGSNTITVTATDAAGNAITETITVARATQGPSVAILSPADGFITNQPTALVTGTVSDSVALVSGVTVNGVPATVSGGTFSATVPLSEGDNTLTVTGINSVGLTTTEAVSGTLDTVPPEITITAPGAGQMVSDAAFTVEGTVSDDRSGVAGVTVNGQTATVLNGTYSRALTLAEGANAITAIATDAAGNTATAAGSVLLDTIPPTLTVAYPAGDLITNNPVLTVSGTASDSGSGLESVTVNGVEAPVSGGAYSLDVTLAEGTNTVTVTATDHVGHVTTITRSVLLDTQEPVITLVSPPEGFINSSSPTVVFSAVDEPSGSGVDLNTVKVYLDNALQTSVTVSGGEISFTPTMPDGAHIITVIVNDIAGNERGLSVTYTVDTLPPEMRLLKPYMRHVVDTEAVEISVEATDAGTGVASVTAGAWALAGDGTYSGRVPLKIGENTLIITATDRAGNAIDMELYMIRLVTDRVQADIARLNALYSRPFEEWPAADKAWFWETDCLRGSYDASDRNRVGLAVTFLAGELEKRGYAPDVRENVIHHKVPVYKRGADGNIIFDADGYAEIDHIVEWDDTTWIERDNPTRGPMETYRRNVVAIRDAQWGLVPAPLPETMRHSGIEDWNNIEKVLVETDALFPGYFAWTAGELSAGEF